MEDKSQHTGNTIRYSEFDGEQYAKRKNEGADAEILNPGQTNFPDYHERFLMLLASKLGIPLPLLTMDATSTNKACYSADTEVLTDKGWKYYWEVKKNDKIVQYDPKTNENKKAKVITIILFLIITKKRVLSAIEFAVAFKEFLFVF